MMLNVQQYAILARHIYNVNKPLFGQRAECSTIVLSVDNLAKGSVIKDMETFVRDTPNNWARIADFDNIIMPEDPFYGGIYIKFAKGRVIDAVICYRGTAIAHPSDDVVDIKSWYSDVMGDSKHDEVPKFYGQAIDLYHKAELYVREYFPYLREITVTGHSLGGALAQLIVTLAQCFTAAVTFNAPGIGDMPDVNNDEMSNRIHNVNSKYGFINKIGKVLGSIDYVDVPNEEARARAALVAYYDNKDIEKEIVEHKLNTLGIIEAMIDVDANRLAEVGDGILAIYPQHSMDNLLATISKNSQIAHKSFSTPVLQI